MSWLCLLHWLYRCCYVYVLLYETLDKFVPSRQDPNYAPKSHYGLVSINRFSPKTIGSGIDLIFVHGLGSNPDTTWHKRYACTDPAHRSNEGDNALLRKGHVNWISDLLYHDLPLLLQQNTRAFFYNYDSYWSRDSTKEPRESLGSELFEHVSQMVEKTPDRKIIFIGHSYGGLVIKEAILQARLFQNERDGNVFEMTEAVIFMGTPHRGSSSASLGVLTAQLLSSLGFGANPDIVRAIKYDSFELQHMHRNFESQSRRLKIVNFYEKRRMPQFWGLWKGYVVKRQSATLDRPDAQSWGLDTDHIGLNKFGCKDSNYNQVQNKLISLMEKIAIDARIGTLVYSVPEKTTKLYTERAILFENLDSKLKERGRIVAMTGLGGMGKTQLALRYAEKRRSRYDTILWVDATSNATMLSSFRRCARALGLSPGISTNPVALRDDPAVEDVLHWLGKRDERYGEWLLVFDNADELDTGVGDIIPSKPHGSVILTSRNSQCLMVLPTETRQMKVGDMTAGQAESLLLSHLDLDIAKLPADMHKICWRICKALHWYPLAVHLAGAQIRASYPDEVEVGLETLEIRRLLDKFLQDFEIHKDDLLKAETVKGLSSYDLTVWTVWDTSLAAIERKYPNLSSRPLLVFLAYMDAAKIPDDIFGLAAKGLYKSPTEQVSRLPDWLLKFLHIGKNGEWDKFGLENALKPLRQYSLVDYYRAGGYYAVAMHGLVRWKANLDGKGEGQPSWDILHAIFFSSAVRQALNDRAYDRGKEELWQFIGLHCPVPQAYLSLGIEVSDPAYHMIGELYIVGRRWEYSNHLREALLERSSDSYGVAHPYTLVSYLNAFAIGYLPDEHDLYSQVVKVWDLTGENYYFLLSRLALMSISAYFMADGRWQNVEEALKEYLRRTDMVVGEDNRPQGNTMGVKALLKNVYLQQGRTRDAEELGKEIKDIIESVSVGSQGVVHKRFITLTPIVNRHMEAGRWKEAEELQAPLLEAVDRGFQESDEAVQGSLRRLAIIYWFQGRLDEAKNLAERLLNIRMRLYGPRNLLTRDASQLLEEIQIERGLNFVMERLSKENSE